MFKQLLLVATLVCGACLCGCQKTGFQDKDWKLMQKRSLNYANQANRYASQVVTLEEQVEVLTAALEDCKNEEQ